MTKWQDHPGRPPKPSGEGNGGLVLVFVLLGLFLWGVGSTSADLESGSDFNKQTECLKMAAPFNAQGGC